MRFQLESVSGQAVVQGVGQRGWWSLCRRWRHGVNQKQAVFRPQPACDQCHSRQTRRRLSKIVVSEGLRRIVRFQSVKGQLSRQFQMNPVSMGKASIIYPVKLAMQYSQSGCKGAASA